MNFKRPKVMAVVVSSMAFCGAVLANVDTAYRDSTVNATIAAVSGFCEETNEYPEDVYFCVLSAVAAAASGWGNLANDYYNETNDCVMHAELCYETYNGKEMYVQDWADTANAIAAGLNAYLMS